MKKIISILIFVCTAIIIWYSYEMGCSTTHNKSIQRIVLISLDTTRADHLSCYGYPRVTTPFIDSLAKRGIRFSRAFSQISTTAPSHSSIFTGLYPIEHKVLKNGNKLSDYFVTLTEVLRKKGYQTVGFASTNTHFIPSNIAQGFDYFNEPSEQYIQHSREKSGIKYRIAEDTIGKVISWLNKKDKKENFFLFVHLFDAHRRLSPPDANLQQAIAATKINPEDFYNYLVNTQHIRQEFYQSKQDLLRIINAYDGELNYMDEQLNRLFSYFKSHHIDKNTLWVITADHGEGLGAHMYAEHGKNIYNEQLHVPLIIFPSPTGQATVFTKLVEHIDIMPTILNITNIKFQKMVPYKIEGKSLLPFLNQKKNGPVHQFALAQRRIYDKTPTPQEPLFINYEPGDKFAIQDENGKYIYHSLGQKEFYNLQTDSYETINKHNIQNKVENYMSTVLHKKISNLKNKFQIKRTIVDKKTIKNLKGLGYIQ